MAKRRKRSALSKGIGVAGKCFMRYEMKKRCGIGRRRPQKKTKVVMPKIWDTGCEPARCCMWYNVDIINMAEYNFMVQNGIMLDFENDRYDTCLQNQAYNKQILNTFRNEQLQKQQRKQALMTLAKWSIITVVGIAVLVCLQ